MVKKKAKSKTTAKKTVAKTPKKKRPKKSKAEINPAEVRKEVAKMVGWKATEMTEAVIDEATKGQLAPYKYLFEVASIYPPAPDGEQATQEEDCLAKMLLGRLDPPAKPAEQEDAGETAEEKNEGDSGERGAEESKVGDATPDTSNEVVTVEKA